MDLLERYRAIRDWTTALCDPLNVEDLVVQSMPDVSPTRWHLAHTTWFFETFLLKEFATGYCSRFDQFDYLFNSYYNTIGQQFPRSQRGMLTRPTVAQVFEYRRAIDELMTDLLVSGAGRSDPRLTGLVEIGLQHEQQHQELIVTDIKHVLSCNPLCPGYFDGGVCPWVDEAAAATSAPPVLSWTAHSGGITEIGAAGESFAFDNEFPRHETLLVPFEFANRPVSNGEYLQFVQDQGYARPELWLSLGWSTVVQQRWEHPLYWRQVDGQWREFTLWGLQNMDWQAPVTHVSFFEADAFARWSGARLPTEFEWETVAQPLDPVGHFAEQRWFQPRRGRPEAGLQQCYGDVWEWTASPYLGYPGYVPPAGAIGEYNGKFMCNQFVLRGGSCATPARHIRASYRNFFPPDARWQYSGLRLAR